MTRTHQLLTVAVCFQLALAGCGAGPTPSDSGTPDAGDPNDAGVGGGGGTGGGTGGGAGGGMDAGATDAGATDAGTTDAGITDAGSPFDESVLVLLLDAQTSFPDLIELDRTGVISAVRTSAAAPLTTYWNYVSGVLVGETSAYLLFLHSVNGGGTLMRLRPSTGAITTVIPSLSFSAWDEAIPLTCDNPASSTCLRFLLHKRSNRTAAVVDFFVGADGGWGADQRDVVVGTAPDYAHWFRLETGLKGGDLARGSMLGMYSPGDGGVGMMRINVSGSDAGMFERAGTALVATNLGNVGANWAAPVPLGIETDSVFFHGGPSGSGAGVLARVALGVNITVETTWPANSFARWAQVASVSPTGTIGQTLFYPSSGASVLGWFDPNGLPPFLNGPFLSLDAGYEMVVPLPYIP